MQMDVMEPEEGQTSLEDSGQTPRSTKSFANQKCWEDSGYSSLLGESHFGGKNVPSILCKSVLESSKDTVQFSDSGLELCESHFQADSLTGLQEQRAWESTPHGAKLKSSSNKYRRTARVCSRDIYVPDHRRRFNPLESPITPDGTVFEAHVGRTTDILSNLQKNSIMPALDIILGYLEPADLCRASCVSKSWRNIIESIPKAMELRKLFLARHLQDKENSQQASSKKLEDVVSQLREQLRPIENIPYNQDPHSSTPRSPPVSPSKVYHKKYIKAAQKLKIGQSLTPCPRCKLPSVPTTKNGALCTSGGCQFHFCIRCLCDFHENTHCPVNFKRRRSQVPVGSNKSRKNLRRL